MAAYVTDIAGEEIQVLNGVVSCGRVTYSQQEFGKSICIANEEGQILGEGMVDQIHIRGPDLAQGYWNKPELTEKVFRVNLSDGQEYMATGDLGKIVDGRLYVMGRIKELIIINGLAGSVLMLTCGVVVVLCPFTCLHCSCSMLMML